MARTRGVLGGLFQKINHRAETLVGMVQQDVLPADGVEEVGMMFARPAGGAAANGGSRNSGE